MELSERETIYTVRPEDVAKGFIRIYTTEITYARRLVREHEAVIMAETKSSATGRVTSTDLCVPIAQVPPGIISDICQNLIQESRRVRKLRKP